MDDKVSNGSGKDFFSKKYQTNKEINESTLFVGVSASDSQQRNLQPYKAY